MTNPGKEHWKVVQWIFRYLRGTSSSCLQFGKSRDGLIGYVDSDYARDLDKKKISHMLCFHHWWICY